MTVYLVGAGPGDPGLITRRGAEVLAMADVVLFDRLVDARLLDLAPPGALRVDVGKRPGVRRHQDEVNALLLEHAGRARTVVRLKGGDPFVFGRGGEEAEALLAAGVYFEVVPGVTSAFAAPASAGTPVTHRGLSSSVTVVSGHAGATDTPGASDAPGGVDWVSLARAGGTLVVVMGMAERAEIARRLVEAGRSPDTAVLVVHRGTTPAAASVRTTLAGLPGVEMEPPATIVIGPVAALDLRAPDDRPLAGTAVVVTRARSRGAPLTASLLEAGAAVVELPVIAVADPPDGGAALRAAAERAGGFDWIVFSSANAVERLFALLPDVRTLAGVRLAAVGAATAAALAAHRVVADVVPEDRSAAGLVAALADTSPGTVLFPRALDARDVLAPGLRALGWEVTEAVAYRTVTAGPADGVTDAALEAAAAADAVVFTSPSTVAGFVELLAGRRRPPVAVSIGPVTAEAARAAGFAPGPVADDPSAAGLVEALSAYVGSSPPGARAPGGAAPPGSARRPPA